MEPVTVKVELQSSEQELQQVASLILGRPLEAEEDAKETVEAYAREKVTEAVIALFEAQITLKAENAMGEIWDGAQANISGMREALMQRLESSDADTTEA